MERKIDISKAISIKFDTNDPNNISNKGLGQIKEYVLRSIVDTDELELKTFVMLIDEIENSLSLDSVRGVLDSMNVEEDDLSDDDVHDYEDPFGLQVFYSTHNPDTIYNELGMNIIAIGDKIDPKMTRNLSDIVFCEGPSDAKLFRKAFPSKLFIGAGGSAIKTTVEDYAAQTGSAQAIVDGDKDGLNYFNYLSKVPDVVVEHLDEGTVEDYHGSDSDRLKELKKFYSKNSIPFPKHITIMNNILEETKKTLTSVKKLKSLKDGIQKLKPDIKKLQKEFSSKKIKF